ncbi:MAG: hypothetical protein K2X09_01005 [Rickettsiales bacterium]|nr:hypothetical protein [Rickettsiales bacterium]
MTPAEIKAREEAKKRALAEDPALGANSHPKYDIRTGATTPAGVAASKPTGPRKQG